MTCFRVRVCTSHVLTLAHRLTLTAALHSQSRAVLRFHFTLPRFIVLCWVQICTSSVSVSKWFIRTEIVLVAFLWSLFENIALVTPFRCAHALKDWGNARRACNYSNIRLNIYTWTNRFYRFAKWTWWSGVK